MGRKPNPLVLHYFHRGAKLEDSSNRYSHTCKSCGEEFPKGRIDSLLNHLTKKCPSLTTNERATILLRLHELGESNDNKSVLTTGATKPTHVNLQSSKTKPNFDGLDVLAEASRRVGANDKHAPSGYVSAEQAQNQILPVDPQLEADVFSQSLLSTTNDFQKLNGLTARNGADTTSFYQFASPEGTISNHDSPQLPTLPSESSILNQQRDLSSIAATANQMLPVDPEIDNDAITAALFESFNGVNDTNEIHSRASVSWQHPPRTQSDDQDDISMIDAPSGDRLTSTFRPIAINPNTKPAHFVTESGTSEKSQKPKVRGRFSSERRQEVQQIRKLGACIRCRMLKKSCTGETPCTTCRGVESPRMWKQPCIRTKLINEFSLFAVGLNQVLTYHDVSKTRTHATFEPFDGRIEAYHFQGPMMITFKGVKSEFSPFDQTKTSEEVLYLINTDQEDMILKIEQYLRETCLEFVKMEKNHIVKTTISTAQDLAKESENSVLFKSLEMWAATCILTSIELQWKLIINLGLFPEKVNTLLLQTPTQFDEKQRLIDPLISPACYSLLTSQLRSSIEKRAQVLSKTLMNDLERRLLQRQQTSRFETFLMAVILLNCAERMAWSFQTWDTESKLSQWPLEKPPATFLEEGDRFAEIVHMILEMRGLPPKITIDNTGKVVLQNQEDEPTMKWFEELGLTQEYFQHCTTTKFDSTNPGSLDGKFFARLLHT